MSFDAADLLSPVLEPELCSFCAPTAEMSLTVSSKPGANVLSLGSTFAGLSVSTALSPVSITFSRAISFETLFDSLAARGAIPKPEGGLPFDDAAPLNEEASVEEAPVEEALAPEEPPDCDDEAPVEAPAEDWALAPTLVSGTL